MKLQELLSSTLQTGIDQLYGAVVTHLEFQPTRSDFEGDITLVVFPLLKVIKGNPVKIGSDLGEFLVQNVAEVVGFNVVSGFLNISLSDAYFLEQFNEIKKQPHYGIVPTNENSDAVMVEFASPNTNKPLHLGHVRNILLGFSVAEILKASGKKVYKTQIINDRGIHICKSMLAWQKSGENQTPESTGLKGDKLVGNFYVAFDKEYKSQTAALMADGLSEDEAKKQAPILIEAQQMLQKWEAGDQQVLELWSKMNQWVYTGFAKTYEGLGVDFDSYYYESDTYLLGKEVVQFGLEKGVFEKDPDGSVWIDLTPDGLDRKIVLRSDGTAVYMTQDIGTAIQRVKDYPDVSGMVYTVGNEQDYHFKVLFLILKKLGFDWAQNLFHLSYGMVDLPSGKMKSREGTVVDADDLMHEMTTTAKQISEELGKLDGYNEQEKAALHQIIGMGALKYYILKVDPKKRILFNPAESVDFTGNTGPFIQYTYARIQSILRKSNTNRESVSTSYALNIKEKELLKLLFEFPQTVQDAAENRSPALIANYIYELVKGYNSFYQAVPILGTEDETEKNFRVQLSDKVGQVIAEGFKLLGIAVPERM